MPEGDLLTIGEVAARTGLRTSAIRYYESAGLLPTPARRNGQRRYEVHILQQIGYIQTAQKAGFTLEEMKTLLDSASMARPYAERVQMLARRNQGRHERPFPVTRFQKHINPAAGSAAGN